LQGGDRLVFKAGQGQAGAFQGIGGQDARPAGIGNDGDAIPREHGLVSQGEGDVEERLHRIGAQHPGLAEGSIISLFGASKRACM